MACFLTHISITIVTISLHIKFMLLLILQSSVSFPLFVTIIIITAIITITSFLSSSLFYYTTVLYIQLTSLFPLFFWVHFCFVSICFHFFVSFTFFFPRFSSFLLPSFLPVITQLKTWLCLSYLVKIYKDFDPSIRVFLMFLSHSPSYLVTISVH